MTTHTTRRCFIGALRKIRLWKVEPEKGAAIKIASELARIGREKEQVRHGSGKGFKYCVPFIKIDERSFRAELGGPDSDHARRTLPLYVQFEVKTKPNGDNDILIIERDLATTYEQAMHLAKHAVHRIIIELAKKPLVLPDGIDKSKWDGFYLEHCRDPKRLRDDFDDVFDKAVKLNYFPEEMREPLREMGFNINEVRPTTKKKLKGHSKKTSQHLRLV